MIFENKYGSKMVLTEKESKIIELIGQGKTNKEIAAEIGIKHTSVAVYIHNLCRYIGARNRIDLYNKVLAWFKQ
jgi:DNA-binding CsgD family transcriptional regulator